MAEPGCSGETGESRFQVDVAVRETAPQGGPAERGRSQHLGQGAGRAFDGAGPAVALQLTQGRVESGHVGPDVVVRHPAVRAHQVGRVGQPAIYLVHGALKVVRQHHPGDAQVLLIKASVLQLFLGGTVREGPRAGVRLAYYHIDELHPVAPTRVQPSQRLDRAPGNRSGGRAKAQKHGPPAKIAQPHVLACCRAKSEVGRELPRLYASPLHRALQVRHDVLGTKVAQVVLTRALTAGETWE